jgi:prevent-host-death family protein
MTDKVGHSREGIQDDCGGGRGEQAAADAEATADAEAADAGREAPAVREVSVRELNRRTSDVISSVRDGERLVVTRYGVPVAVALSITDAFELVRGTTDWPSPRSNLDPRGQLRDALRATVGNELERQVWHSELSRYLHGRWRPP